MVNTNIKTIANMKRWGFHVVLVHILGHGGLSWTSSLVLEAVVGGRTVNDKRIYCARRGRIVR